jgi:hypothetical protein
MLFHILVPSTYLCTSTWQPVASFGQIPSPTLKVNASIIRHFRGLCNLYARPVVIANVTRYSNSLEERMIATPGSPGPAGSTSDRRAIQSESNPAKHDAHEGADDDVECMVTVVKPARRSDEERHSPWYKCENDQVDRRRSALVADRETVLRTQILAEW